MVDNKSEITIDRNQDDLGILFTFKVNQDDMWVIIWKWWNTINSIRSLLRLFWMKINKRINLKVLD